LPEQPTSPFSKALLTPLKKSAADEEAEAHSSSVLLGWIDDIADKPLREALDNVGAETMAKVSAAMSNDELSEHVLKMTGKRVSAEILTPAGLYAVRALAAPLVDEDGDVGPVDAIIAVLNAMWVRIGSRPGQWLNSLALIGKRISYCSEGTQFYARATEQPKPTRFAGRNDRPIPKNAELSRLAEADHAKTLAPKLLRDLAGLQAFLAKHGGEVALNVMTAILWRHTLDGKSVGSVRSWKYFEDAIAEARHKEAMQEQGIRPGDAFGTHKKWSAGDA
jgi:hypothetical protein